MANRKITQLTAIDAMAQGDLFAVVDDPAGTPVTKKATLTQVLATAEKLANKGAASGYAGLDADGKVTLATIQSASGESILVGRGEGGGAGSFEEITLGANLLLTGSVLSASGGGGGGGWSFVTSVAATAALHDFPDLDGYNEVMLFGHAIDVASGCVIQMLVSVDNGANFMNTSGNYLSIDASTFAGAADTTMSSSNNGSGVRYPIRTISNFNTVRPKHSFLANAVGANSTYVIPTTTPLNAIRIRTHTGALFTAGTFYVYGRA